MKPVNLTQRRKEKARAEKKARADANAVKFGTPPRLRKLEAKRNAAEDSRLDGVKLDK